MIRLVTLALLLAAGPAWAAFPTIQGTPVSSADADASDGITMTLPTGIQAGEFLVCGTSLDDGTAGPADWSSLGWTSSGVDQDYGAAFGAIGWRVATGSEGSSITLSVTGAGAGIGAESHCFRWGGQHASSAPEFASAVFTAGNVADPPNLAPTFGGEDIA
jgi:hypothetical protein